MNKVMKKTVSRIWDNFVNYFKYFGWLAVLFILVIFGVYFIFPKSFPVFFLVLLIIILLTYPTKFVYSLVGAQNSLRSFFLLFIITQILFSFFYHFEIKTYHTVDTVLMEPAKPYVIIDGMKYVRQNDFNMIVSQTKLTDKAINTPSYRFILMNTFYVALIQECSPGFQSYIDKPDIQNRDRFFMILNIHIFISWIFLGVLIASLYQKLRNE